MCCAAVSFNDVCILFTGIFESTLVRKPPLGTAQVLDHIKHKAVDLSEMLLRLCLERLERLKELRLVGLLAVDARCFGAHGSHLVSCVSMNSYCRVAIFILSLVESIFEKVPTDGVRA